MNHHKAIHAGPYARAALVLTMLALSVPLSVDAAAMKQTKRYESPSSFSAYTSVCFVSFEGDGCGIRGAEFGEPLTFRVPPRARSARITIADDRSTEVRAVIRGDLVEPRAFHVACASSNKVRLARGARILMVALDAGHYEAGFLGADPCPPLSFPTSGTVTVVFSLNG